MENKPGIVFAGDRDISVKVLKYLLSQSVLPQALIVQEKNKGSHVEELLALCDYLDKDQILVGESFCKRKGIKLLNDIAPDYIVSVHFPYFYPSSVLSIPKHGILNLHPAYLPFNRGWHTPTWALLDGTPYGATLHFMSEEIDKGCIVHRKIIEISPEDTAHSIYLKVKELEFEVFCEAWPSLSNFTYQKISQSTAEGSFHKKNDLDEKIRRIDLHAKMTVSELVTKLRALTTSQLNEAAYFEIDGNKYLVQIEIKKIEQ